MTFNVLVDIPLPQEIQAELSNCNLHFLSKSVPSEKKFLTFKGILTYGHDLKVDNSLMAKMPALQVISNIGVGIDHIDLKATQKRGIPVGNTPNILDGATADMTFALLLAIARNVVIGDHYARSLAFTKFDPSYLLGYEVNGTRLGIIGLGNIGRQVARRANGFNMETFYHNRTRNPQAEAELGVKYASLNSLLSKVDYISLNVPLTSETQNLIGRKELLKMKPTAILVNLSRGGVLNHDALLEALEKGWIAAAAIDVTEPEPLPRNHPLLKMDNLVITPHLGSATIKTRRKMGKLSIDNLMAGLEGRELPSPVV